MTLDRLDSGNRFKMPFIELQSNLAGSSFSEEFMKKLSSCTAAALGKPENVSTCSEQTMSKLHVRVWTKAQLVYISPVLTVVQCQCVHVCALSAGSSWSSKYFDTNSSKAAFGSFHNWRTIWASIILKNGPFIFYYFLLCNR